jgi:hypothetical protein
MIADCQSHSEAAGARADYSVEPALGKQQLAIRNVQSATSNRQLRD